MVSLASFISDSVEYSGSFFGFSYLNIVFFLALYSFISVFSSCANASAKCGRRVGSFRAAWAAALYSFRQRFLTRVASSHLHSCSITRFDEP